MHGRGLGHAPGRPGDGVLLPLRVHGLAQGLGRLVRGGDHVLQVRVRHQGEAELVLHGVELAEVLRAEALFVRGNARVRLHHRAAQRHVQELPLARVLHGAKGALGLLFVGVPNGDGVQMNLRHCLSLPKRFVSPSIAQNRGFGKAALLYRGAGS